MSEISNLTYLGFGVSDLDAWERFAIDAIGFQVGHRTEKSLSLRMDQNAHRVILEKNDGDDIRAAGWTFDTDSELEAFVSHVRSCNVRVDAMSKELLQNRRVEKGYVLDDPIGFRHELVTGPEILPISQSFVSSKLKSDFVTGPLGMGHFLPLARDGVKSVAFFKDVLKLRVSDYIKEEVAPGIVIDATFFHTKTGRHHSLATAPTPAPAGKILTHFMVQVADISDVGMAYDRCQAAGYHIVMELGHHPNDEMFSFYVGTPSGFALEFGWGGLVIDDANWEVVRYSQLNDWGHRRNPLPASA